VLGHALRQRQTFGAGEALDLYRYRTSQRGSSMRKAAACAVEDSSAKRVGRVQAEHPSLTGFAK
jgi:hypothetical protein